MGYGQINNKFAMLDGVKTWIYSQTYPKEGLIGRWTFENDLTDSYNDYDLTRVAGSSNNYVEGKVGFAIDTSISTNTAYGTTNADVRNVFLSGVFSLSGWYYFTKNSGWNFITASKQSSGYTSFASWVRDTMIGFSICLYNIGCYSLQYDVDSRNAWHHIVITLNGTTTNGANLYYDGNLVKTGTNNRVINGCDRFTISTNSANQDYWKGKTDQVYLYNRVLSLNEVKQLYNGGAGI